LQISYKEAEENMKVQSKGLVISVAKKKGGLIDIRRITQNTALFVSLL
jgi:hypothetical protein